MWHTLKSLNPVPRVPLRKLILFTSWGPVYIDGSLDSVYTKGDSMDTFDDSNKEHGGNDMPGTQTHKTDAAGIPEWVTTGEAKRALGVGSVNTIKRWIREGKLEGRQYGEGSWVRVSNRSIFRLMQQGDPEWEAIQRLHNALDTTSDLGGELTEEDLHDLSDRRVGKMPWDGDR